MAQYGSGEQQYVKEGDQYAHNPLQSTTVGHENMGGTNIPSHGYDHEQAAGKHDGGILHRTGSGSSSSSEDDGEGGRRKKKGVMEKIKEKVPGGDHGADEHKTSATTAVGTGGGGYGHEAGQKTSATTAVGTGGGGYGHETGVEAGHEKKGLMDKIKEKLPGGHQ